MGWILSLKCINNYGMDVVIKMYRHRWMLSFGMQLTDYSKNWKILIKKLKLYFWCQFGDSPQQLLLNSTLQFYAPPIFSDFYSSCKKPDCPKTVTTKVLEFCFYFDIFFLFLPIQSSGSLHKYLLILQPPLNSSTLHTPIDKAL